MRIRQVIYGPFAGSVDAFSAALSSGSSSSSLAFGNVYKFDVVIVNIRGGYDPSTGGWISEGDVWQLNKLLPRVDKLKKKLAKHMR